MTGKNDVKIKIHVLQERVYSLWFTACWELQEDAGRIFPIWIRTLDALCHKMASENQLSTVKRDKNYFGVPEMQLLLSRLSIVTHKTDWWKQHYVAWALTLMTGARPSSLAVTDTKDNSGKDIPVDEQQCLRWRDIEFLPNHDSRGLAVRVKLKWIKGQRDLHNKKATRWRGITFFITSCSEASNLPADVPWLLLVLGFERGLFSEDSVDKLLQSPLATLPMKPDVAQRPVFLAANGTASSLIPDKPLLCQGFNPPLKKACEDASIAVYATMYCWRREFISYVGRSATMSEAKELATHQPGALDSYSHYDFGVGDKDLTGIRLGEIEAVDLSCSELRSARRNEMRQWLSSPALNQRRSCPKQDEYEYVNRWLSDREDVAAWNSACATVMNNLWEKFQLNGPKNTRNTIRQLRALHQHASAHDSSTFGKPDDIYDLDAWLALLENVSSAGEAATAFQSLITSRCSYWKWIRRALIRAFHKQWLQQTESVTLAEKEQRKDATRSLPDVLVPKAIENQSTVFFRQSVPVPVLDQQPFSYKAPEDISADLQSIKASMGTEDEQADELEEEALQDLEADMEELNVGEALLDEFLDAQTEGLDIVVGHDVESPEAGTPPTTMEHRRYLMQIWLGITDVNRGNQPCPFCKFAVVLADNKIYGGTAKICRHLLTDNATMPTHGNYLGVYMDSCITSRRISGESGKEIVCYRCRLCAKEMSDNSDKWFRKHIRENHPELYKRLAT